jgi:hypothetical protein
MPIDFFFFDKMIRIHLLSIFLKSIKLSFKFTIEFVKLNVDRINLILKIKYVRDLFISFLF